MKTHHLGYHYKQFTFSQILADKAEKLGDKVFLQNLPDGRLLTYREMDERSNQIANGFLASGISQGTHIAMLMENSPEQVLTYFALGKIGAVVVPINIAARGDFLAYYMNQSDCSAIVVDGGLLEHFLAIEDRSTITTVFVVNDRDLNMGSLQPPSETDVRFVTFESLLENDKSAPLVEVSYRDICAIMYTSGTTGPSKGNLFTQIHSLTFGSCQAEPVQYDSDDIYHTCLPLFHAAAYGGALLTMLVVGGGIALTRRLSVSGFWDEIRRSGSTRAQLLSVTGFIWNQPAHPDDRNHSLRTAMSTPVPEYAEEFRERFGVRLLQGYGLSDFGLAFSQAITDPFEKRLSIGMPLADVEARIVDEDDVDVPTGETGEIVLRKDGLPFAMTQGYYNMPEATAISRQNLWFHTGDRGWRDNDGYFYFADRKKDMIRRRGENISAYEVETAILKHPKVADVAVYAVATGTGDEDVGATVTLKEGSLCSELDLIDHCAANMPYYMVPRYLEFRAEMPRTMTQKIQKHILREEAILSKDRLWDREKSNYVLKR